MNQTSETRHNSGHREFESPVAPFSVLISVYKNDHPQYFDEALHSISTKQSWPPNEIVLVVDGPVSGGLDAVIRQWEQQNRFNVKVIRSPCNVGLANALNLGLKHCSHEYVARMDSDDISLPMRFERQLKFLQEHPSIALLGGWYEQYDNELDRLITDRKVPTTMADIVPYSRSRTPFNHVTAIFKKSTLLEIGCYPNIQGYMEDWWIALRLIKRGYSLANLPEYLVMVRGDREFIRRRGGWNFLLQELANLKALYQQGLIGGLDLVRNVCIRSFVRLLPHGARTMMYQAIRRV
jgi:glycosyltransferase involved in cell wall biosynthesis